MLNIQISSHDHKNFGGYLAQPATLPAPGILLIQEIFGVNKVMRDLADDLAKQGYAVLCPDLFWRQEPGVDITDQSEAEWQKAFSLFQGFDLEMGMQDLKSSLSFLRDHEFCSGKVGTVGYCLGGKLAFLMSTRSDVDAAVSYYGVEIDKFIDEPVRCPLLMHVAEKDQFVPPDAQAKIFDGVQNNPLVTAHVYQNMDHAFARVGGAHYDAQAAALANDRTKEFFKARLVG